MLDYAKRCARFSPVGKADTQHKNSQGRDMDRGRLNVLLIGEGQRSWWHLARQLELKGCHCWFASTLEEVGALLDQHPFHLVLSARPVTEQSSLMPLLRGPERSVFYAVPIEDSCLWFQAVPEDVDGRRRSAFRPSEFMSVLDDLIAASGSGRSRVA